VQPALAGKGLAHELRLSCAHLFVLGKTPKQCAMFCLMREEKLWRQAVLTAQQ
jgi:hypothetical protein